MKKINRDIKIINLEKDGPTREEYSIMLMNYKFWEQFIGDKLLIYQEDSIIFKKLEKSIYPMTILVRHLKIKK